MTDNLKPYLVCTAHRGVFAGLVDPDTIDNRTLDLTDARMAIRFGATMGVMQLAHTGPTHRSKISAPADIDRLHDVTAVISITPEAWAVWQAHKGES